MFKILQARLQLYVNHELPDVQSGFRKGKGTGDQISNICWIVEKAREFQKNIYFCFIDYDKAFDCVDHNKLWKILHIFHQLFYQEMPHSTCQLADVLRKPSEELISEPMELLCLVSMLIHASVTTSPQRTLCPSLVCL